MNGHALRHISRCGCLLPIVVLCGCASTSPGPHDMNTPDMMAWVELMMPRKIEIQKFTQPISRAGDGQADALEVVLGCVDSSDEFTRVIGTFQFELQRRKLAQGLKFDQRVAYWRREITTADQANEFWERYARYYRFPLAFDEGAPEPGEYVLQAQLTTPSGQHLFDELALTFDESPVPPFEARF